MDEKYMNCKENPHKIYHGEIQPKSYGNEYSQFEFFDDLEHYLPYYHMFDNSMQIPQITKLTINYTSSFIVGF